jgi:uncharacterized membrane protein
VPEEIDECSGQLGDAPHGSSEIPERSGDRSHSVERQPERLVEPTLTSHTETRGSRAVVGQVTVTQYEHSGPLPDQAWFQAVERIHPGTTELILSDYQAQREHERRIEQQSLALDRESFGAFARYQTLQLVFVALIATLIAAGGIILVATGTSVGGLAVLVGEIAALVLAFFGRGRTRSQPNDETQSD